MKTQIVDVDAETGYHDLDERSALLNEVTILASQQNQFEIKTLKSSVKLVWESTSFFRLWA